MSTISTPLDTKYGWFNASYHGTDESHCVSLTTGDVRKPNPLVRLHSSCLFGETFRARDCDCNLQVGEAMERIGAEGRGVLIYLYQEGRGAGLENKIRSMELEINKGIDTVEAYKELKLDLDNRDYSIAIEAMNELKVDKRIRLMSENPRKVKQLEDAGFTVEMIPFTHRINKKIKEYLRVKKGKLGHNIDLTLLEQRSRG